MKIMSQWSPGNGDVGSVPYPVNLVETKYLLLNRGNR